MEPVQPRTALIGVLAVSTETLFETTSAAAPLAGAVSPGRGRVACSSSRLLLDSLATVYDSLGFTNAVDDEVFRDLAIAWLVEPASLADTGRVLSRDVSPISCT